MNVKKSLIALGVAVSCLAGVAQAAYPDRAITLVVPYAPGGAADAIARLLSNGMAEHLGVSIVVENRPGASGTIGAAFVARAAPDGYTVLYDATPFSINPQLFPKMPFDSAALQPLSLVTLAPNILIVKPDAPFSDVGALIEQAKAKPGKLNFASGGSGTVQRLASELFRQKLNLNVVHVPYKSGGPAIVDVMGGQVDFSFSTMAASYPLIASGKLRALAISSLERSPLLPDVPTVAESAIPGYEALEWNGLFVPAGTPATITTTLHKALLDVLENKEIQQRLADLGSQPVGSSPEEFAAFLKEETEKWAQVIKAGNISLD